MCEFQRIPVDAKAIKSLDRMSQRASLLGDQIFDAIPHSLIDYVSSSGRSMVKLYDQSPESFDPGKKRLIPVRFFIEKDTHGFWYKKLNIPSSRSGILAPSWLEHYTSWTVSRVVEERIKVINSESEEIYQRLVSAL